MPLSPPAPTWRARLAAPCALAAFLLSGSSFLAEATAARMTPSPSSVPQPRGAAREEILRLLESTEPLPREADWAPLGPEALTALAGLVQDPKAPEPQRARAVAAMAVVPHPEAPRRLQELLAPASPASLRAAAAAALGRRVGLEAIPLLAPLLQDSSEQVRASAARTLGRVGGAEARRLLEERLSLEENLAVREALQQGLSYLEP